MDVQTTLTAASRVAIADQTESPAPSPVAEMRQTRRRRRRDQRGATLLEYSLLVGLISIVSVASMRDMGGEIRDMLNTVAMVLGNVADGNPPMQGVGGDGQTPDTPT